MNTASYTIRGGRKRYPAGHRFSAKNYYCFQLIYVSKGTLWVETPTIKAPLHSGDLAVFRQGSDHCMYCKDVGYEGFGFSALGNVPDAFKGPAEVLTGNPEIRNLASLIEQELASPGPEYWLVYEGLGRAMAWQAIRILEGCTPMDKKESPQYWAAAARAAIDSMAYSPAPIQEVLSRFPMRHRQIGQYFTDVYKRSPKQYQQEVKIHEAQRLLTSTMMKVTEIALELGFASSQHFATQFKTLVGKTPRDFRENPCKTQAPLASAGVYEPSQETRAFALSKRWHTPMDKPLNRGVPPDPQDLIAISRSADNKK